MNNMPKSLGKTKAEVTMLMICLLLTGCGMQTGAEAAQTVADETSQSVVEQNAVLINIDEMDTQSNPEEKQEKYCNYLGQIIEKDFADEEGIESADAVVSYDEKMAQYSVEVSLKTNGRVESEKIEDYITALGKNFSSVTLLVDGDDV